MLHQFLLKTQQKLFLPFLILRNLRVLRYSEDTYRLSLFRKHLVAEGEVKIEGNVELTHLFQNHFSILADD